MQTHKKVYIHSSTALKIGQRIDKQTALQDKIIRVFGTSQLAQKFLLEKELQALLVTDTGYLGLVF